MQSKQSFINIYDEFRDAELNKKYYAIRMSKIRKSLRNLNIFLALFTGSSGVAGFAFWKSTIYGIPIGPTLFAVITGTAVVLAIARPYLKLEDELERLSSIQGSYDAIAFTLKDVVMDVKTNQEVTDVSDAIRVALRQVRASFGPREDKPADRDLIENVSLIVNKRYPQTFFWYPETPNPTNQYSAEK